MLPEGSFRTEVVTLNMAAHVVVPHVQVMPGISNLAAYPEQPNHQLNEH